MSVRVLPHNLRLGSPALLIRPLYGFRPVRLCGVRCAGPRFDGVARGK